MSTQDAKSLVPAVFAGIIGASVLGYFLGFNSSKTATEEDGNFSKLLSELRAERNELFLQLLENANYNARNKLIPTTATDKFILFGTVYCPFVQRAWLTLVEKKIPFEFVYVNVYNKSLTVTKRLLQINPQGTVPAGLHKGHSFAESMDIVYYLEETFPNNPLIPTEPSERYKIRAFIRKHSPLVDKFYATLQATESKIESLGKELSTLLAAFNGDIVGPYIMGNQFTIADIAFLPFFTRIELLLGYFKNFKISSENTKLLEWMKNCTQRESYKVTTSDRTDDSMQVEPFRARQYKDYLFECYSFYAVNRVREMKLALANAEGPLPQEKVNEILGKKD